MIGINFIEKVCNIFLNTMQKIRLKIPFRYQEIVKKRKYFSHL